MAKDNSFLPILFCFIGPAGSGKSSICTSLLKRKLKVNLSISSTTREPRHYEENGREYFFLTKEDFRDRIKNSYFLEYAEFAGNFYGTEKINISRAAEERKNLLLDIEPQGVKQLRSMFPKQVVVIFLCPPSIGHLKKRLEKRASDSPERIAERLELAKEEMKIATEDSFSDYIIVNESLDESIKLAEAIILSEPIKRNRLPVDFYEKFWATNS